MIGGRPEDKRKGCKVENLEVFENKKSDRDGCQKISERGEE